MTKTTLFALANVADTIIVAGYTAEERSIFDHTNDGVTPETLRLTDSHDADYYFPDQEVELLPNGEVLAMNVAVADHEDEKPHRLQFLIERPITVADLQK